MVPGGSPCLPWRPPMYYVQSGFALLGILLLVLGRVSLGRLAISKPIVSLVGLLLLAQFLVSTLLWVLLGVYDLYALDPAEPGAAPPGEPFQGHWFADLVVTGGMVLLAGVLAVLGLRSDDGLLTSDAVRTQ